MTVVLSSKWGLFRHGGGLILCSPTEHSVNFIVFDVETCGLFDPAKTTEQTLNYFQKCLRFAVKNWNGLRLSITERLLGASTKAVIFPNPISRATDFRICVELNPDGTRQARRPQHGRSMLVYRSGTDEGEGRHEEASSTNFRKFLEARKTLPSSVISDHGQVREIDSLHVTTLEHGTFEMANPHQGYERWLDLLTEKQKMFVLGQLNAPHRIEGPAGTGKTLSLVLKCITGALVAKEAQADYRAIFITHSEATRRSVQQLFLTNGAEEFLKRSALHQSQQVNLTTLQQLCGSLLQKDIQDSEFVDRDAFESKQLQILYVLEAITTARDSAYPTYKKLLSPTFQNYLQNTEVWTLAEMLQHEISVVIKGRADENLENYRKIPRLKYGLPVETSDDRGYVWEIFRRYQRQLQVSAQFDTDDIVLSTIGQLDTPLWRRRRARDGYDAIYIDETHLFNINELSIFHYLTRSDDKYPIAYSVDRSQAIGDRDWTDARFDGALVPDIRNRDGSSSTRVDAVFRCSPEILNLAFSVTSSGATLFTNFDDPLRSASSIFTATEERKCELPTAYASDGDDAMIQAAFKRADAIARDTTGTRGDVAIVMFTNQLFTTAQEYAKRVNKPTEVIDTRGDLDAVQRAERNGKFVLTTPEFIGGLEFNGVVLVGVDEGRVPPARELRNDDSSNFLTYAAHNRLYVAITRARFRVEVLFCRDRGVSPLLRNATASGSLLVNQLP